MRTCVRSEQLRHGGFDAYPTDSTNKRAVWGHFLPLHRSQHNGAFDHFIERIANRQFMHHRAPTVAQFLEEELPAEGEEERVIHWSEADESVDREIAAYHRLHPDLWRKYPGQQVAIQNGRAR